MKKMIALLIVAAASPALGMECTDFSGNWEGTCQITSFPKKAASMTIKQDSCDFTSVLGEEFPIGEVIEKTEDAGDGVTSHTKVLFHWDDNRDVLKLDINIDFTQSSGEKSSVAVDGSYKISDSQLITKLIRLPSNGDRITELCVYEKQ